MLLDALALLLLLAAILSCGSLFATYQLEVAGSGRVSEELPWSLALAVRFAAIRATAVASGARYRIEVHVGERRVWTRASGDAPEPDPSSSSFASRLMQLDPVELLFLGLDWATRLQFTSIHIHLDCASLDPAVLGRICQFAAVGEALFAPFGRMSHAIDWVAETEKLEVSGRAVIRVVPAEYLLDLARFAWAQVLSPRKLKNAHVEHALRSRNAAT